MDASHNTKEFMRDERGNSIFYALKVPEKPKTEGSGKRRISCVPVQFAWVVEKEKTDDTI